eukprot:524669_1
MGNSNGNCFTTDGYYFFSDTDLRFCERYLFMKHEYMNCISALVIAWLGFYNLFFYQHNISLLRFISSSLMANGIFSFCNHWTGERDWLFIDNISLIITLYLLLKLLIDTFTDNYDYVIITAAKKSAITKKYGRAASVSRTKSFDAFGLQRSVSVDETDEITVENVLNFNDFVSRPVQKIIAWIFCVALMFFFIVFNINGCNEYNIIFIVFILIIPLFVFTLLILFYVSANSKNKPIGTIVHSADMSKCVFRYFIRGIVMILIGNLLWIITQELCSADHGWKYFPGVMFYNLFTFYGYSLISMYIIFLNNDLQRKICYLQTMKQRKLCIGFMWFHYLFPSIKISNNNANKNHIDENIEQKENNDTMDLR